MATVQLTKHLFTFFPQLEGRDLVVPAETVKDVVRALDELAPGLGLYLCDERGVLRTHVNIFIGDERILDRRGLSDAVSDDARVFVLQSLSGG